MLIVYGEQGRPLYAVEITERSAAQGSDEETALRAGLATDAIERLEAAGQAVADACEHLLGKVREGLSGGVVPAELEIKFGVSLAGEGGLPIIGKASAEASFEVRALWSKPSSD